MYSPIELAAIVGKPTYDRGVAYADRGMAMVEEFEAIGRQGTVSGFCDGSGNRPYVIDIDYRLSGAGVVSSLSGRCTCPVGYNCKHVIALLITALRESRAGGAGGPASSWEVGLRRVLQTDEAVQEIWPLALVFDYSAPETTPAAAGSRRLARWTALSVRGRLVASPMRPGKRVPWVASNIGWSRLRSGNLAGLVPEHAAALNDLRVLQEMSSYYSNGGWIDLTQVDSPVFWDLLERAAEVGVTMLAARDLQPVRLEQSPGSAQIAITRKPRGDVAIAPIIGHPALPQDLPRVLLGTPPHGIAWESGGILHLAPLERQASGIWQRLTEIPGGIDIPAADRDRFEHGAFRQLARAGWSSPDGSFEPEPLPAPVLHLDVALTPTGEAGAPPRALLHWFWRYGEGPELPLFWASGDPLRDREAESAILDVLPIVPVEDGLLTGMEVVELTEAVLPRLEELGVVVSAGTLPDFQRAMAPRVRVGLGPVAAAEAGGTDWLDLELTMEVEGHQIPMAVLVTSLTGGEESIFLPGGIYVSLADPALDHLRDLLEEAALLTDRRRGGLRVPKVRTSWWDEFLGLDVIQVEEGSWLARFHAAVANPPTPGPVPKGLHAELRPYQLEGYRWLSSLRRAGLGGVLADDMGLGKTVQALAMIQDERENGDRPGPWLVVAPTSVVPNWVTEAARFVPDLTVVAIEATAKRRGSTLAKATRGADIVVTSYTMARLETTDYASLHVAGMILDEAQQAKNPVSRTFASLTRIGAPVTYAITGTPMENNLGDLWAMFALAAPGLLGSTRSFNEAYRRPIERGADAEATRALMLQLQRRIAPFLLRRAKSQVAAELPPKQEQILAVDLAPAHRRLYDRQLQRERLRVLHLAENIEQNRVEVLSALTRLRQLAIDPSLVDEASSAPSSKLEVLIPLLQEAAVEGHRVLVFSQFTRYLHRIADRLEAEGIAHVYLDGTTRDRRRVIADFVEGDAPVFLISLKAGGVGLNLTMADYVILTDPWWNPAVEEQAIDRTHRIGQDSTVLVYRLVSAGTIEEKVLALQETKRRLFEGVVGTGDVTGAGSTTLSADELRDLLA